MTREQAQAILVHLDLIRHFADGHDIGFVLLDLTGRQLRINPTNRIILSNLRTCRSTHYVKLKDRLVYDAASKALIRACRCYMSPVPAHEVMP